MERKPINIEAPVLERLNRMRDPRPGKARKESVSALIARALDCLEKEAKMAEMVAEIGHALLKETPSGDIKVWGYGSEEDANDPYQRALGKKLRQQIEKRAQERRERNE
jgi:hypothetical protein